ncbi:efflux transporter outer membrane subunit [Hellea sp.]|nr:efflux transporter outer membrane subunit [Hellea sp.]
MIRRLALVSLATGFLTGCTTLGPDYVKPSPDEISGAEFVYAGEYDTVAPLSNWWTAFDDPILNGLVETGISRNNSLRAASANLAAARAALGVARSNRLPSDEATITRQQVRTSSAPSVFSDGTPLPTVNLISLGTDVAWEVDLFGRVTRTIEIAKAQSEASFSQLVDLQTVIIADIADNYLDMRGAQAQLTVAEENALVQTETLRLTELIRDAGRGTDLDVEQARAQLETTRASIPPLRAQIVSAANNIAVLTGQTPQDVTSLIETPSPLPTVQAALPIGNPAELLRRRPDVAASERLLAAAVSEIGLEMASAYPRVDLVGGVVLASDGVSDLDTTAALGFNFGPSISWSLGNFLTSRNRVDAAEAEVAAAYADYEQALLVALAETESALNTQAQLQKQLTHLRLAENASLEAARLSQIRFRAGRSSFLQVLDAQGRALLASDQRVATETEIARAQVAVFRALRAGPNIL